MCQFYVVSPVHSTNVLMATAPYFNPQVALNAYASFVVLMIPCSSTYSLLRSNSCNACPSRSFSRQQIAPHTKHLPANTRREAIYLPRILLHLPAIQQNL